MATLSLLSPLSMAVLTAEVDPNGNPAKIAEVLTQENAMLQDAPWQESNDVFSVTSVQRLSIPTGTHRGINEGVGIEAAHTRKRIDTIAELMSYSEIDATLVEAHPSPETLRNNQAIAFIEGMGQTMASKLLYGDTALNPKEPTGFAPRLDVITQNNVFRNQSSGGTVYTGTTSTSIYAVQWGIGKVYMAYPRGMGKSMGILREDKGKVTKSTATTGRADSAQHEAYRDVFTVRYGLVVEDDRCIARLSNIRGLAQETLYEVNWKQLIEMLNKMPKRGQGAVLYVPQVIYTQLDIIAADKTNVQYGPADAFGQPVMYFRGHAVRQMDKILTTETALT